MVHGKTIACIEKAKLLLENQSVDNLRYASLQLRMGIENLFYELIPLYADELPADIATTKWQPKAILDEILECDPLAENDAKIAFGSTPGQYDLAWEQKAPNKRLLKKHYHRLGSYLHAPVDQQDPELAKWTSDLEKTIAELEKFHSGQVLSNIRTLVEIECVVCKGSIKRNKRGVEARLPIRCPNPECRAIYDVDSSNDDLKFNLRQNAFNCPHCEKKNWVSIGGVSHGTVITCDECEGKVVVQNSFAILPFDESKASEPKSETHGSSH